jgi:hypothetical protein
MSVSVFPPKLLERILIRFGIGGTHISVSAGRPMEPLSKFALTVLTCILEVSGSNLSGGIGFPYGEFRVVLSPSSKCHEDVSN